MLNKQNIFWSLLFSLFSLQSFAGPKTLTSINVNHYPISDMKTGDLDHDGKDDIVISFNPSNRNAVAATVICWDYQHTFDITQNTFTNCTTVGGLTHTSSIAVVDNNQDGYLDIVQFNTGNSFIFINDHTGHFTQQVFYSSACDTLIGLASDFNHDGKVDIAYVPRRLSYSCTSGSPVTGDLTVIYGGTGVIRTFTLPNHNIVGRQTIGLASAPISRITSEDMIIGNFRDGGFYILKSQVNGNFVDAVQTILTTTPRDAYNFSLGDVNADGKPDILIPNFQSAGPSYVYSGIGNGTFSAGTALPNSSGILNFAIQNVDGIGASDIVAQKSMSSSFYKLQNGTYVETNIGSTPFASVIKTPMVFWNAGNHLNMIAGYYNGTFKQTSLPPYSTNTCPPGRITSSTVTYVPSGSGSRPGVNLGSYDAIWGHATATDTTVTWPGRPNSSPVIAAFNRNGYIAAAFTVPVNTPSNAYGWLTHTEYNYGTDLTASISTSCGDFAPVDPNCLAVTVSGQILVKWFTSPHAGACVLTPGQTYYYNIKATNPLDPWMGCPPTYTNCPVGTANNFNGF